MPWKFANLQVLVDGELAVTSQQSGLQVTLEVPLNFEVFTFSNSTRQAFYSFHVF